MPMQHAHNAMNHVHTVSVLSVWFFLSPLSGEFHAPARRPIGILEIEPMSASSSDGAAWRSCPSLGLHRARRRPQHACYLCHCITLLMLAFLSPAASMTIAAKPTPSHNTMPAVVIPAKKPTETRKLLVDLTDAPLYEEASKLWSCDPFEPHRSPMGSIVFSLVDEGDVELTVATVYASLGLPSDDLEAQHADLLTSPCTLELLDIETAAAHRRHAARASISSVGVLPGACGRATGKATPPRLCTRCSAGSTPIMATRCRHCSLVTPLTSRRCTVAGVLVPPTLSTRTCT